ncbi:energy transducer TonB, partial [Methylobacterium sp. WL30]
PEHNAPKPPCPSWKPVIPNQPVGGPPQRWEASKPPPIPCQPRVKPES